MKSNLLNTKEGTSKTFLVAILLLTAVARAQDVQAQASGSHRHGSSKDPALGAIIEENNAIRHRGEAAERRGDYAEAERRYKEYIEAVPHAPVGYLALARLYDRWGRDREAYEAYRIALKSYEPHASSIRESDSLARYGDLASRFENLDEARAAYALAIDVSDRDDVWDPRAVFLNGTLKSLRAAAHTSAAIVDLWGGAGRGGGCVAARRELDLALAADPNYWVAYYYRVHLDRALSDHVAEIHDAATAERLAPPKGRRQVRWMRAGRRIPDAAGRLPIIPPAPRSGSWAEPPELRDSPVPSPRSTKSEP